MTCIGLKSGTRVAAVSHRQEIRLTDFAESACGTGTIDNSSKLDSLYGHFENQMTLRQRLLDGR